MSSAIAAGVWGLKVETAPWIRPPAMRYIGNGAKWYGMYHRAGIPVTPDPKRSSQIDPMMVAGLGTGRHVDRGRIRPPPQRHWKPLAGFARTPRPAPKCTLSAGLTRPIYPRDMGVATCAPKLTCAPKRETLCDEGDALRCTREAPADNFADAHAMLNINVYFLVCFCRNLYA